MSNIRYDSLNIEGMDEDALMFHLIVVDFAVELSVVLTCARRRVQSAITLFLSL